MDDEMTTVYVAQGEIEEAFTAAGGNLREALFALYDRAEARRSGRRS